MEPCLTKPIINDVHWLHLVGVVKVLTENLCTRGWWEKQSCISVENIEKKKQEVTKRVCTRKWEV